MRLRRLVFFSMSCVERPERTESCAVREVERWTRLRISTKILLNFLLSCHSMNLSDAVLRIDQSLSKKEMITLYCHCEVNYSGRAESYLDKGDRVVMIKEDGTLLIHQPQGNTPVNYMKPASTFSVSLNKGIITLHSKNLGLKEYMDVLIHDCYGCFSRKLQDGQSLVLQGTEKDMAEMIMKNPSCIEDGFVPLNMEEHTKFGFIDVFGHDRSGTLLVVECKRYTADFKAVSQLERYVEKIKSVKGVENVRGIIAAPKISPNAKEMLEQKGFSFVALTPPKHLEKFNKDQQTLGDY